MSPVDWSYEISPLSNILCYNLEVFMYEKGSSVSKSSVSITRMKTRLKFYKRTQISGKKFCFFGKNSFAIAEVVKMA